MDVMTLAAKLTLNTSEFNSNLKSSESKMGAISKGAVALGNLSSQAVIAAGRAIKNFAKDAMNTSMGFDSMMASVKAVANATDDEYTQLRQKAMQVGATTKFTAEQAGQALYYMGMAGWDTTKMLEGLDGVISLAAASGEDLGTVSDIVTDALTAFGMSAEESSHFANMLATTATHANTNVSQMGQAFKYIAPIAGAFNLQAEDIAESIGLIANQGIKGSQAGTSMRRILLNLATDINGVTSALDDSEGKFGVSFFEKIEDPESIQAYRDYLEETKDIVDEEGNVLIPLFDEQGNEIADSINKVNEVLGKRGELEDAMFKNNKVKDWNVFLDEMRAVWNGVDDAGNALLTDAEKADWAKKIAGQTGSTGWLALMNASQEEIDRLRKAIEETDAGTGDAAKMADTMIDNLQGDITILNSALDGLKIVVSDSFKGQLRSFVQALTEEIGHLNEAFQENGVLGMFVNLADWVVNGITDALMDTDITGEGASKFGEALGDFVGRLVSNLVTKAPELLKGLFSAGVNLASGLLDGLFSGLFGTGQGTIPGLIIGAEQMEEDAIKKAEKSSTEAKGILEYMDTLKAQYGEAAENTAEWATALERLKEVYPEINEYIATEGGNLSATNQSLLEYIENSKKRVEQEAKKAALQKYIDAYSESQQSLTEAQIEKQIAQSEMSQARESLIDYIRGHKGNEGFTGKGLDFQQIEYAARAVANEFGESQTQIDGLKKAYEENAQTVQSSDAKIKELETSTAMLKTAMDNASTALAKLAGSAGSYTPYGAWANNYYGSHSHAKGLWDVPYDGYVASLHRSEMVLTASQARKYREGQYDSFISGEAIGREIRDAMGRINVLISGEKVGDLTTKRVRRNINATSNSRLRAMGG